MRLSKDLVFANIFCLLLIVFLTGCSVRTETVQDARIISDNSEPIILNVMFRYQTSQIGCGIAALSTVLSYWDFQNELSDLEQTHSPDTQSGYSIRKLISVAQAVGLKAFVAKMDENAVKKQILLGRPVIVPIRKSAYGFDIDEFVLFQFIKNNILDRIMNIENLYYNHYVVLSGFNKGSFLILDPSDGVLWIANDRLAKMRIPFDSASLLAGR